MTISFFLSNASFKLYKIGVNLTNLTNIGLNNMINNKKQNQAGFTLVELSIVLVIIGLIVSGVLAGQALIQQAKVRGQLRQIEELKTAIGAFQSKYDFLPGDLPNPIRFFSTLTAPTTAPNGNGLIDGAVNGSTEAGVAFWELSLANLIQDRANGQGGLVRARIANVVGIVLNSGLTPFNWFQFGVGVQTATGDNFVASAATFGNGLTGSESYAIDSKIDDGKPGTGSVLLNTATQPNNQLTNATAAITGCASATDYYVDEVTTASGTSGSSRACRVAIRIGF